MYFTQFSTKQRELSFYEKIISKTLVELFLFDE
jgi:hypothetical protein